MDAPEHMRLAATFSLPIYLLWNQDTVEHLAARVPVAPLQADAPEIERRLSNMRIELMFLMTGLHWGDIAISRATECILCLLDAGPLRPWAPLLESLALDIDRTGLLLPVWLKLIEQVEATTLLSEASLAESLAGRACCIAIRMLGNYKVSELSMALGRLAQDARTSLYATEALTKQATGAALHALVQALQQAEGWAKVDIIEACLALKRRHLQEVALASGLEQLEGLEHVVVAALFRSIDLENYLPAERAASKRLGEQAALVLALALRSSMRTEGDALPLVFERDLLLLVQALLTGAVEQRLWQHAFALHQVGLLLGYYWNKIGQQATLHPRIVAQVYACAPLMPDIEGWMKGIGREVLRAALQLDDDAAFLAAEQVFGDMGDARAISTLLEHIEAVTNLSSYQQAIQVERLCELLEKMGDRRAAPALLRLVLRTIHVDERLIQAKRACNLTLNDTEAAGSIVYAAVMRVLQALQERDTLDFMLCAAHDFDPYVRGEALRALKRLDAQGNDARSRTLVREALHDPSQVVVQIAHELTRQYGASGAMQHLYDGTKPIRLNST